METDRFQVVVDHLVRMTQEITEIKSNQQHFSERLTRIENDHGEKLRALTEGLDKTNQTITRIENDHGEKLRALFDAREVQLEVNDRILSTLSRIEEKLDNLSIVVSHHDRLLTKGL
ncbi:MAG TPA: hypothetical protein DEB05_09455 [Firmicutes bacterium]|nr:hypothetical protein [Bacillota bacterium]